MDGCTAEEATRVERSVLAMKTLRFLALLSFFSFFFSYYSVFPSYNVQFSTLIVSLFAHAMDRKYMFLICNGIVAFLVNNLSFSSPAPAAQDSVKQITLVQENAAFSVEADSSSVAGEEEMDNQLECIYQAVSIGDEEMKAEYELEEEEEDEDEDEELGENKADASVSTEELNQKFEEFIKKMKEEIRIEAMRHLITVYI